MPPNMVDSAKDEKAWKRAKAQAAKAGHAEDWPYVVSIYQAMAGKKGAEKGTPGIPANFGPNVPRLDPTTGMGDASTWVMGVAKPARGPLGPMVDVLRKATMTTAPDYETPSGMAKLVVIQGLRVNIEQVPGDMRHGRMMGVGYGDIAGTMASDGEPFDCYIGQNKDAELVYVIDQLGPDGQLDEHKAMVGFDIAEDAARAYCSQMGSNKMGGMVAMRGPDLARFLLNNPEVSAEPFVDLVRAANYPMVQVWAPMTGVGPLASPAVVQANGGM
jgi:hypothetical protein